MFNNKDYYDESRYDNGYSEQTSPEVQKTRSDKVTVSKRFFASILLFSMAGSAVFGFSGAYFAYSLNKNQIDTASLELNLPPDTAKTPDTAEETDILSFLETTAIKSAAVTSSNSSASDTSSSKSSERELMTISEAAAAVKDTVVEIVTETVSTGGRMGQFVNTGAGSGVIVTASGYIVTNNHVISGANSITVRLTDGSEYKAALVGADAKTDLAVIKINKSGLKKATYANMANINVGDQVIAIGNPLGELGGTVTEGIISALGREITIDNEAMTLMQTSAAINPGNSGGGLFNLYGELIGIVNAKSSGTDIEGLGFAIPADTAKTVANEILEYGYVRGRVKTGLTVIDISDFSIAMMYRVNKLGLYVYSSEDSNFKSGDRIISINGTEIDGLISYNKVLNDCKVGDKLTVVVSRNGKEVTCSLTLTEAKE